MAESGKSGKDLAAEEDAEIAGKKAASVEAEDDDLTIHEYPWLFYGITAGWFLLVLILFAVGGEYSWSEGEGALKLSYRYLVLAVAILWAAASVKVVEVDEVGGILLYGLPMISVGRGPKFVLWGVFQLERFQASVVQNQFPDEPEFVQKTSDDTPLESVEVELSDGTTYVRQKVRPIRITTRGPYTTDDEQEGRKGTKEDILNSQMTVELNFWVRWQVEDPFKLIIASGGSVEEAQKQMRDAGESLLNKEVTQRTPSQLISDFTKLQESLREAIRSSVKSWGIRVAEVGLIAPDLNHEVAKALRDIPVAKARAVKVRTLAEASAYALAQRGKGRGEAREAELAGEGRGYKQAGESIGVEPKEVLAAQVARDTVGESDLVLGAEGIAQAVGIGKAILNSNKEKKE